MLLGYSTIGVSIAEFENLRHSVMRSYKNDKSIYGRRVLVRKCVSTNDDSRRRRSFESSPREHL